MDSLGLFSRSLASEILEILEIVCYDGFGKFWISRVILEILFHTTVGCGRLLEGVAGNAGEGTGV